MTIISQENIDPTGLPQICERAEDLFAKHSAVALSLPKGNDVNQQLKREETIKCWVAEYLLRLRQEPPGTPLTTQLADHLVNAAQLWFRGEQVREPEFMPTCNEVLSNVGKQGHLVALNLAQLFSRLITSKDTEIVASVEQLDIEAAFDSSITTGLFSLKLVNDIFDTVGRRLIDVGRIDEGQDALRKSIEVVMNRRNLLVDSHDIPMVSSVVARVNATYFYLLEACQDGHTKTELIKGLFEFQSIPYRFLSKSHEKRNNRSLAQLEKILSDLEFDREPDFPIRWAKLGAHSPMSPVDSHFVSDGKMLGSASSVANFVQELVLLPEESLSARKLLNALRLLKELDLTSIDPAHIAELVSISIKTCDAYQVPLKKINLMATLLESGLPFQAEDIARAVSKVAAVARGMNEESTKDSERDMLRIFSLRMVPLLGSEAIRGALMCAEIGVWLPSLHSDHGEEFKSVYLSGLRKIQKVLAEYMGSESDVEARPVSPELGRAGIWVFNDLLESSAPRIFPYMLEAYLPYLRASAAAVLVTKPDLEDARDIAGTVFSGHSAAAGIYAKKGDISRASRIWDAASRFAEDHQLSRARLYGQKSKCLFNLGDRGGSVKALNDSILESFRDLKEQVVQGGGIEVAEHLARSTTKLLKICGDRHVGSTKVALLVGKYIAGLGEQLGMRRNGEKFTELARKVLSAGLSKTGEVQRATGEALNGTASELRNIRSQIIHVLDLIPKH